MALAGPSTVQPVLRKRNLNLQLADSRWLNPQRRPGPEAGGSSDLPGSRRTSTCRHTAAGSPAVGQGGQLNIHLVPPRQPNGQKSPLGRTDSETFSKLD